MAAKRTRRWRAAALAAAAAAAGCAPAAGPGAAGGGAVEKLVLSDAEWRARLTPEQYRVLRGGGTECAFTGAFHADHRRGVYRCAGCALPLFRSGEKFESGSGWPSFLRPAAPGHVEGLRDTSHGMIREEVRCARCGGHLGHVFGDGPPPTGLRYCINSAALVFEAEAPPAPPPSVGRSAL